MSTATARLESTTRADLWTRMAPWTGLAFVAFFLAGVLGSSPPSDSASNARWTASYATDSGRAHYLATGVLLILAALCLGSFLTHIWSQVADARKPHSISPLPLVAAGVATACIAVGGVFFGVVGGDMLLSSSPLPDADLLRFCNDIGFVMVGIPGMLATALGIACLSIQARAAGIFGRRLLAFSLVVAVILLASLEFIPIAALLIWAVVVAVALLRAQRQSPVAPAQRVLAPDSGAASTRSH